MTPEEFARHARAEAALRRIPGVFGVGYGLKEVGGKTTDRVAFRVYVRHKQAVAELAPEARVPAEFEGVPTDVLRVRVVRPQGSEDTERHDPLIGGISITNFKSTGSGLFVGTLGCFATLDGVAGPENVVGITNQHVVLANGGGAGSEFFQPAILASGAADEANKGAFGETHSLGKEGNHPFAYPSESLMGYYVDCATVKLNICLSSWCNVNCGISYKNELRELSIGGSNQIHGVARAVNGEDVFKSGRQTGATEGRITDVALPSESSTGEQRDRVIEIESTDPTGLFSDEGDSGAVVLNDRNEIVGLHYGGGQADDGTPRSYACHIHPVLDVLKVTPISTANPPAPPAGKTRSDARGFLAGGVDEATALRRRFLATPRGAEIMARVEAHRGEVVSLVNHRRAVTVAWHRAQGPAFLAHAIENARRPAHRIPFEIEGVGRRALLERMAEVLAEQGGSGLAAALAAHHDEVLALAEGFDDLHELVGRFEAAASGEGR